MTYNKSRCDKHTTRHTNQARAILPAIVAVGSSLAAGQAGALELGPIEVQSKLGQPLRASIAYALAPNEMLESYCVTLAKDRNAFADVAATRVSVANGIISLTGRTPIHEPLLTANLVVNCPYTANISRNYSMFIDPIDSPVAFASQEAREAQPAVTAAPAEAAQPAARAPVTIGSRYQVQSGDTLSEIAWRLEGREIGLQAAMDGILEANPRAFIDQDPNRLLAGRWLDIPAFAGTAAQAEPVAATEPGSTAASEPAPADTVPGATVYDAAATYDAGVADAPQDSLAPIEAADTAAAAGAVTADESSATPAGEPVDAATGFESLRPGDIVDEALVAGATTQTVVIPDTTIANPAAPAAVAPTVISNATATERTFWDWLPWFLTAFFAATSGYLAFGERLRRLFGSKPIGAAVAEPVADTAPRQAAITIPESEMQVEETQPQYGSIDFDLSDDSPTEENLALDANLFSGVGLAEADDETDKQEFGFASTTSVDMELPDKPAVMDMPETDIIAPPERTREEMILDKELLPDDDEYDMSIIVDATKMPNPEEVTERDLKAVPLDEDRDETLITDVYTINDEVDIDMLELDYEDEMTATQALNAEIEKAAAEIAPRPDEEADHTGETSVQVRLASVTDLDVTAEMAAGNDQTDTDDTANIEADDETIEMPADNKSAG
jgi:phage tail protein X